MILKSFIPFWIRLHPLTSLKISCSPLLEGGKVTLRPSGCKVTLRPSGCKVTFQYNTNNYIYYEMYIKIVYRFIVPLKDWIITTCLLFWINLDSSVSKIDILTRQSLEEEWSRIFFSRIFFQVFVDLKWNKITYLLFIVKSKQNRKFSGNFSYLDLSRLFW